MIQKHLNVHGFLFCLAMSMPAISSAASGPGLQLNKFLYRQGDTVTAVIEPLEGSGSGGRAVAGTEFSSAVMLVGEHQRDVELLALSDKKAIASVSTGQPITISYGQAQQNDGQLQLMPGENFFAYLFWKNDDRPQASLAIGTSRNPKNDLVRVEPRLARASQLGTDGRSGVVAGDAGMVEIAVDHIIYHPRSLNEQARLLQLTRGTVIRDANSAGVVAVGFDPMVNFSDAASAVLTFMDAKSTLVASSEPAAAMFAAVLCLQLQGFRVAVDPAMQWHAPTYGSADGSLGGGIDSYVSAGNHLALSLLPGMRESWIYAWLFELDRQRINVGVIDSGFAPNFDFRGLSANQIWHCDFANHEPADPTACLKAGATGPAAAPQAVGNSFFGGKSWHGTGVVTAAVGLLNNGYGGVGSGGQVGVPMLYRTDLRTYALQFSDSIREAANDGAAVINISAGYPCRIFKVAAAPYEICNAAGRAQLIHDLWASAVTLAGTVCGPFAPICLGVGGYFASDFVDLIVEGGATDLREILKQSVADANQRGVVVVASAGNRMTEGFICAIVDCADLDVDNWQLIPCVIEGVICVGALGGLPGAYRNQHYVGSSVDLWAPTGHTYSRPIPDDLAPGDAIPPISQHQLDCCINATSGAAPVVAGIVALLVAGQPSLNIANPNLTAEDRSAIPERVRSILDATSIRQTDVGDSSLVLKIVSPYAALRMATQGLLPDAQAFAGSDWFDDVDTPSASGCGTNEDLENANKILLIGEICGGSIVAVTPEYGGSAAGIHREDIDVTGWRVPADGRYRATISVTTPSRSRYGYVGIDKALGTLSGVDPEGNEVHSYATLPYFANQVATFRIGGIQNSDNLYRLTIGAGDKLPNLKPDRFDESSTHPLNLANNDASDSSAPIGVGALPTDVDGWEALDTAGSKRILLKGLTFHTEADTDWFTISNIPSDAGRDCGSVLTVSAPADIRIQLYRSAFITPTPDLVDEDLGFASLRFASNTSSPGVVKVALRSDSHAALDYEMQVGLMYLNRVVCNFEKTALIVPLREPLRWPLAARPVDRAGRPMQGPRSTLRPVILYFDHPGGGLRVTGRLVQGRSATAELLDQNGRRVWIREVGTAEMESAANGGYSVDATVAEARPGRYFLALKSNDALAEMEIDSPVSVLH
jgi:hypothetical protein